MPARARRDDGSVLAARRCGCLCVAIVALCSGCHWIFSLDSVAAPSPDEGHRIDGARDLSTDGHPPDSVTDLPSAMDVSGPDQGGGPTAQSAQVSTLAGTDPGNPFCHPMGVAVDPGGVVYVAGTYDNVIWRIEPPQVTLLAGTHWDFCYWGSPYCAGDFCRPGGVAVDPAGAVYVGDCVNNRVRKIDGSFVTTVAGGGNGGGDPGYLDGSADSALFRLHDTLTGVCGLAVTTGNEIVVADAVNQRIRKIANGEVTTLAGSGVSGHHDAALLDAMFDHPTGVAAGPAGDVYVADTRNNCIRVVSETDVTTLAGDPDDPVTFADGSLAVARFNRPSGLVVDSAGRVFVADAQNHRIRMISGNQVTTIAGTGTGGFANGAGAQAMFFTPTGIALDASGKRLIVADRHNHMVRAITW